VDPLDRAAALWLDAELAARFPGLPVRYVVHTTRRLERAEGGAPFNDTAELVAHRTFNQRVAAARGRFPREWTALDRDRNNVLDAGELAADPRGADARLRDRNGDGRVTAGELYALVQTAESAYDVRRTITLGDRTAVLLHPGSAYGSESTAVYFPAERLVFVERAPGIGDPLLPETGSPRDVVFWARTIAGLDVDLVVTGRGDTLARGDVAGLGEYVDALITATVDAKDSGQGAAAVAAHPGLDAHRGRPYDVQRDGHVAEAFRRVSVFRMAAHGAGVVNGLGDGTEYCATFTACARPRLVTGGSVGVSVSRGRAIAVAELALGGQVIAARTSPLFDDAIAHRETILSVLGGYSSPPARRLAFNVLGGVSYVVSDAAGLQRRKQAITGSAGQRAFGVRHSALGLTGGVDLQIAVGHRMAVVMPLRLVSAPVDRGPFSALWPGPLIVQGGIGLRYRLMRRP
jgi:hypothetical protein